MKHISEIMNTCDECNGSDLVDGPVPDDEDRTKWWSGNGDEVECPICERGLVEWDENWLSGGSPMWRARIGECEHCEGKGRIFVDRCPDCYRLEGQYGKGPKRIREADRLS